MSMHDFKSLDDVLIEGDLKSLLRFYVVIVLKSLQCFSSRRCTSRCQSRRFGACQCDAGRPSHEPCSPRDTLQNGRHAGTL